MRSSQKTGRKRICSARAARLSSEGVPASVFGLSSAAIEPTRLRAATVHSAAKTALNVVAGVAVSVAIVGATRAPPRKTSGLRASVVGAARGVMRSGAGGARTRSGRATNASEPAWQSSSDAASTMGLMRARDAPDCNVSLVALLTQFQPGGRDVIIAGRAALRHHHVVIAVDAPHAHARHRPRGRVLVVVVEVAHLRLQPHRVHGRGPVVLGDLHALAKLDAVLRAGELVEAALRLAQRRDARVGRARADHPVALPPPPRLAGHGVVDAALRVHLLQRRAREDRAAAAVDENGGRGNAELITHAVSAHGEPLVGHHVARVDGRRVVEGAQVGGEVVVEDEGVVVDDHQPFGLREHLVLARGDQLAHVVEHGDVPQLRLAVFAQTLREALEADRDRGQAFRGGVGEEDAGVDHREDDLQGLPRPSTAASSSAAASSAAGLLTHRRARTGLVGGARAASERRALGSRVRQRDDRHIPRRVQPLHRPARLPPVSEMGRQTDTV
eukprot:scaffold9135_cov63-Phaeocystis_antarctica.AAC.3